MSTALHNIHLNKQQAATANHRPGKPDMLSQYAKAKSDRISQHAKCRLAIPTCITKVILYKGLQEPKTVNRLWESEEPRIRRA